MQRLRTADSPILLLEQAPELCVAVRHCGELNLSATKAKLVDREGCCATRLTMESLMEVRASMATARAVAADICAHRKRVLCTIIEGVWRCRCGVGACESINGLRAHGPTQSMVLMVRDALLDRKELQLQTADVTSLIASVTAPSPPVRDWNEYLGWVAEAGLPESVFVCASESDSNQDVVTFALYCLQQWLEKDVARVTAEIVALHRLPLTLVALMKVCV